MVQPSQSTKVQNAVLECNLKNNRMISVCFQGKPFSISVLQVYVSTSNTEKAEVEWFQEDLGWGSLVGCHRWGHTELDTTEATQQQQQQEDLQDLLELTLKKDVLFIIRDWNAKVGSQETPEVTGKFCLGVQNEAGQRLTRVLPREHTGHSKHPLPTTQEKTLHMDITRWSRLKSF